MPQIQQFIRSLRGYTSSNQSKVYNPWKDHDGIYDIGREAPRIRRGHLENYLRLRVPSAKFVFVAEALGFQGGHFSGIAMTSERILLGMKKGISPSLVINCKPQRTSNPEYIGIKKIQSKSGYNEPTATVVWESIIESDTNPKDIILWNMFPFHPHEEGILTNRTPSDEELIEGIKYLNLLTRMVPQARIIAIGNKSKETLSDFGIEYDPVVHPANGHSNDYRKQISKLLKESN